MAGGETEGKNKNRIQKKSVISPVPVMTYNLNPLTADPGGEDLGIPLPFG